MFARSKCRYVRLNALNAPHVPRACFIAPHLMLLFIAILTRATILSIFFSKWPIQVKFNWLGKLYLTSIWRLFCYVFLLSIFVFLDSYLGPFINDVKQKCIFLLLDTWLSKRWPILLIQHLDYSHYSMVRIEFSPLWLINVSNGHWFTLESTDNDQLVVTSEIWI